MAFPTNPPSKADDQMPTIGHIGRYALKYKIGAGGLGTVYAAHDPLLSRLIAFKTLNLEIALESSRVIGMAMGIIMANQLCTADQAFDMLRRVSQETNRKLRDVALDVSETGTLP